MTPEQFAQWIKGLMDSIMPGGMLTLQHTELIKAKLATVKGIV